jgi:hypothetical protein
MSEECIMAIPLGGSGRQFPFAAALTDPHLSSVPLLQ